MWRAECSACCAAQFVGNLESVLPGVEAAAVQFVAPSFLPFRLCLAATSLHPTQGARELLCLCLSNLLCKVASRWQVGQVKLADPVTL